MFVHNLTIRVDNQVLQQWLKWQKEEYVPAIVRLALFTEIKIFELLELNDQTASTFVLQYFTDTREKYNKYANQYSETFREKYLTNWGDAIITFETLMQSVD